MLVFLSIWITLCATHILYRIIFQYKYIESQPEAYRLLKNILSFLDLLMVIVIISISLIYGYYVYLIILPISILLRVSVNFFTFKRESKRLYTIYINGGNMDPASAHRIAHDTIKGRIRDKKII